MSFIIGIDVGSTYSGICIWDTKHQEINYCNDSLSNKNVPYLTKECKLDYTRKDCYFVIEDIKSYGMPVGATTFDTCKAIGRFQERIESYGDSYIMVSKPEVQVHFCNTTKAKDANIKRVLKDRFGEKGTKKKQGVLYNLKSHSWDAFALCIYYEDVYLGMDK
jgi:hypothetical protein